MTENDGGINGADARPAADSLRVSLRGLLFASLLGLIAAAGAYGVHSLGVDGLGKAARAGAEALLPYYVKYVSCPLHYDDGRWASSPGNWERFGKFEYLIRHMPGQHCEADSETHWRHVEELAGRPDWPEARFWLSLKYAYGDFYGFYSAGGPLSKAREGWSDDDYYRASYNMDLDPEAVEENQRFSFYRVQSRRTKDGGIVPFGDGQGVDYDKARALLIKAAEGGDTAAQLQLSQAYYSGSYGKDEGGFPKDLKKSTEWLEKAVNGDAGGCAPLFYLGYRYYHGIGADKDIGEARRLFGEAARQKYSHARSAPCLRATIEFAWMNAKGEGGAADYALAQEMADKALRHTEEMSYSHLYGDKAKRYVKTQAQDIARHIAGGGAADAPADN